MSPADFAGSLLISSRDCSPAVETRAAQITSASLALCFTKSTDISLRKMASDISRPYLIGVPKIGLVRQNAVVSATPRSTIRDSLSVSITVGAYGIAFGAAGVAAGFSILQTSLLSLLTFSGASQFTLVGVMGAGGTAISGIATAALLGFRNGLYGLRMSPLLKTKGAKRFLAA